MQRISTSAIEHISDMYARSRQHDGDMGRRRTDKLVEASQRAHDLLVTLHDDPDAAVRALVH